MRSLSYTNHCLLKIILFSLLLALCITLAAGVRNHDTRHLLLEKNSVNQIETQTRTVTESTGTTVSVALMADHILGKIQLNPNQRLLADRDRDDGVSVADIILVMLLEPPQILSYPPVTAEEGNLYLYEVYAEGDQPGDELFYELENCPKGMYIDKSTGLLSWVPQKQNIGKNSVTIAVKDAFSNMDKQTYELTVEDSNDPPVITSFPTTTEAKEGEQWSYQAAATDPDSDPVSWSLGKSPEGMTIDPTGGLVLWTPGSLDIGTHEIWIRAEDGKGGVDIQIFTLSCSDVNSPPVITSPPPDDALTSTVYTYQVEASDPDPGDDIGFLLETAPEGMKIDIRTGLLVWHIPPDAAGDHPVKIRVIDNVGNAAVQEYTLKVSDYNHAPIITSVPQTAVLIGDTYRYDVEARDLENDPISFSLSQKPSGMTIDPSSGLVTWTPGYGQGGTHTITIQAKDPKGGTGEQTFELLANPGGEKLVVTSVTPDDGTTNVLTSENVITYTFSAPVDPQSVEGAFGVFYTDWESTGPIPMTWKLSPDLRRLTLTVSPAFEYTPPKLWSSHVPAPCEPGRFPGSYGREGYPWTTITARLGSVITDQEGNPLVPFTSGFSMFRRFIYTGKNGTKLVLSPDGKFLAVLCDVQTGGHRLDFINADWKTPDGHLLVKSFSGSLEGTVPHNSFFTPDSRLFYCCPNYKGQNIRLIDMETLTELPGIPGPDIRPGTEAPRQLIPTKDWKKAYVFFNCSDAYHTGSHLDILDIDPASPRYHDWITTDVLGPFIYFSTPQRHSFSMLPGGDRLFLSQGVPGTPIREFHWGVMDIDPLSETFNQFIYSEKFEWIDSYNPSYQVTPNGKWLYGSPSGYLSCGSCGYFGRKLIQDPDPANWISDKAWANAIGYADPSQIGCAPDSRTIYYAPRNRYIMVYDIDLADWIDADENPLTTQGKLPDHGPSYTDFPEGVSLFRNQLWEWWPGKIWENVAAACFVPPHNRFFYFTGGSLVVEVIPTVENPWLKKPGIEIISPVDGSTVAGTQITVAGFVKDNRGVASVTINGNPAEIQNCLFWGDAKLVPGNNVICARAVDIDGNASSDTVTINHDPNAPLVSITSPANHSRLRKSPILVQGTVNDPAITKVTLNGYEIDVTAGTFTRQFPLTEGINLFHAEAENASGKTGSGSVIVHYEYNEPPSITSIPPESAEVGTPYSYDVDAVDPNGDTLIYSLLDRPSGMTIDPATGEIHWTPTGFDAGKVQVIVVASDGWDGIDHQKYAITVIPSGTDTTQPRVSVIPETVAPKQDDFLTVVVDAVDDVGVVDRTLSVNGNPEPVTYNAGTKKWEARFRVTQYGENVLVGRAKDASTNTGTDTVSVYAWAGEDHSPPNLKILKPDSEVEITTPTAVYAVIGDEHLVSWTLEYALKGDTDFSPLTEGTNNILSGKIYDLLPEDFLPGTYILRLRAEDLNFLSSSVEIEFTVNLKRTLGYNEYESTDLSIPMMGMEIAVKRLYNSFEKGRGDFGVGWKMDDIDVRLIRNENDAIIVKKPDGQFAYFILDLELVNPFYQSFVRVKYIPFGPTFDTLDFEGEHILFIGDSGDLLTWPDFQDFQPEIFKLTTRDGITYTIQSPPDGGASLLKSIEDRNGNKLTIKDDGIFHSAGMSISFTRDSEGRITKITDPMGKNILYEYDGSGDLVSVTNRKGFPATFTYDANHNLLTATDPSGVGYTYEYDANGRVIALIDGEGNRTRMDYEPDHRREIITDSEGNPEIVTYDEKGRVISRTNALNQTTYTEYNDQGLPIRVIDYQGNATLQTWDTWGNLLSKTDPLGNRTSYTYNAFNKRTSMTDPRGNKTTYSYDARGNPASTTDPMGGVTLYEYDAFGNKTKVVDPLEREHLFTYDAYGRLLVENKPGSARITNTYNANGMKTATKTIRSRDGVAIEETTLFEYDPEGNLLKTTLPDGSTRENTYDEYRKIVQTTDPKGRKVNFNHDGRGLVKSAKHQSGRTIDYDYDKNGRINELGSSIGVSVTAEHDELGRVKKIVNPDGTFKLLEYDEIGNVVQSTDELGHATFNDYDSNGNLMVTTDTLGSVTTREYDPAGNMIKLVDPKGHVTEYEYDARNLNTRIRYHDGTARIMKYDAAGQKILETDPAGNATHYSYDEAGNLSRVVDPLGNMVRYSWDETGNLIGITDANDHGTSFTHDSQGRLIQTSLPGGQKETRSYDETGRLIGKTDFNGQTIQYEYDNNYDLLLKTIYPDGSEVTRKYDGKNRMTSITNTSGTLSFGYDNMDRITSVTDPFGKKISYTYDAAGNRTKLDTPFGDTLYEYDALNRLVKLVDHTNAETMLDYDAVGNLLSIERPNSVNTDYEYDSLNRLLGITHTKGGSVIDSFTYTLGKAGNRIQLIEENGRSVDYSYDKTYRLTGENITDPVNGNRTISYTYDPAGNRLTKTDEGVSTFYNYDANDRLIMEETSATGAALARLEGAPESQLWAGALFSRISHYAIYILTITCISAVMLILAFLFSGSLGRNRRKRLRVIALALLLMVGPILLVGAENLGNIYEDSIRSNPKKGKTAASIITYDYDKNGNLIEARAPGSRATLSYDHENRLKEVISPKGYSGFSYDGLGNRIEKRTGAMDPIHYLLDRNTQNPVMPNVQVLAEMDGSNNMTQLYTRAFENLVRIDKNSQESWVLQDGTLSTRLLANATGNVTDRWIFEAFGKILNHTGSSENEFLFAGQQRDPNTGYYFLRARYYNPESGRFLSTDPRPQDIFDPKTIHRYVYAFNNPVRFHDPSGEGGTLLETAISSAIIGGLTSGILKGLTSKSSGLQLIYEVLWAAALGALFGAIGGVAGGAFTTAATNLAFSASSILWVWGSRAIVAAAFATFVATPLAYLDIVIWGGMPPKQLAVSLTIVWLVSFVSFMAGAAADFKTQNMICDEVSSIIRSYPRQAFSLSEADEMAEATLTLISKEYNFLANLGTYMDVVMPFFQEILNQIFS